MACVCKSIGVCLQWVGVAACKIEQQASIVHPFRQLCTRLHPQETVALSSALSLLLPLLVLPRLCSQRECNLTSTLPLHARDTPP